MHYFKGAALFFGFVIALYGTRDVLPQAQYNSWVNSKAEAGGVGGGPSGFGKFTR